MDRNQHTGRKPRILILGSTGRTGKAVIAELGQTPESSQPVYASRNREQVEAWRREGKDAVYLDLDDARTFPAALQGVDRLFLATGYTIQMVHQSKTIVDAAADAGVKFIVHLGIFGNGRMTDPHFAWHEMVERYIEGSGVSWSHIHPHFFLPFAHFGSSFPRIGSLILKNKELPMLVLSYCGQLPIWQTKDLKIL